MDRDLHVMQITDALTAQLGIAVPDPAVLLHQTHEGDEFPCSTPLAALRVVRYRRLAQVRRAYTR